MLIYSVASGSRPFSAIDRDTTVIRRAAQGERPANPNTGLFATRSGNRIFQLVGDMWHHEPGSRPSINEVLSQLGVIRVSLMAPPPVNLACAFHSLFYVG